MQFKHNMHSITRESKIYWISFSVCIEDFIWDTWTRSAWKKFVWKNCSKKKICTEKKRSMWNFLWGNQRCRFWWVNCFFFCTSSYILWSFELFYKQFYMYDGWKLRRKKMTRRLTLFKIISTFTSISSQCVTNFVQSEIDFFFLRQWWTCFD